VEGDRNMDTDELLATVGTVTVAAVVLLAVFFLLR
jgi:negative regulator of sigma E activity